MAAFGEPPGGQRDPFNGQGADPHQHTHPMNPLVHLFAHMMGGNGQIGDAVYSQEALDRIISQLMEQNATSNAPGPAPQAEIDSLPRKDVTVDMLGPEGRAECSICMEEVNIGEQVTELPCKHWFHHACVAAWLGEHDTCPHCRKSISKQSNNPNQGQGQPGNNQGPSGSGPSRAMPGAFGGGVVAGEGTPGSPFYVPGSPPPNQGTSNDQPPTDEQNSAGGGIGERLRRGLFGPPSR
jgi:fission 1 protein/division protein 1